VRDQAWLPQGHVLAVPIRGMALAYGGNEWSYEYDDDNKLKGVRLGQNVVYSCVYDAFGRPAVETVNGVTRYLVWEGDELLLEINPVNGAVAVRHVWDAGGYQGYYRNEGGSPTRLALRDGLGHVRGLMNTSKSITDRYVFDAYGNDMAPNLHNTTEGNALRFRWNGSYGYRTLYLLSGQQSTNTATVMHVGARHYAPCLRRWLQRDRASFLGGDPNCYKYCSNDPVSSADPSGLCRVIIYKQPGGKGVGSHLIIGLKATDSDSDKDILWFSFYPVDPGSGKAKKGPGVIVPGSPPEPGGEGAILDINSTQYWAIKRAIVEDMKRRAGLGSAEGVVKEYKIRGYNCADWVLEILVLALGEDTVPRKKRAEGHATTPLEILQWVRSATDLDVKDSEWEPSKHWRDLWEGR